MSDISEDNTISPAIQSRLVEGEEIIKSARIHWGIFWQPLAVLVLGLLFLIFVASELGILLIVTAGLMAAYRYALKSILLLVLTNKRILFRYGLLQVDVVDIHFDKIESIELERMPTAYLMGYANIVVMGTGQRRVSIPYTANGPQIRKAYNEIVLRNK